MNSFCIMCPIYKAEQSVEELVALTNNYSRLAKHKWFLVCPESLVDYVDRLKELLDIQATTVSMNKKWFKSTWSYSRLCKSVELYRHFEEFEYLVIAQLDALVFGDDLEKWHKKNYDYIGGAWISDVECEPWLMKGKKLRGGNGGLSIRRIRACLEVLQIKRRIARHILTDNFRIGLSMKSRVAEYIVTSVLNQNNGRFQNMIVEDIYWSHVAPHITNDKFRACDMKTAIEFSFERQPARLFKSNGFMLPFGCHAWERYDRDFWIGLIREKGILHPSVDERFILSNGRYKVRSSELGCLARGGQAI